MERKIAIIALLFGLALVVKSQNHCFCDTTAIVNYVDTFYWNEFDTVSFRIDRETGKKYFRKTVSYRDTTRLFYQINDSLQEHGEGCAWYKNGQLAHRHVYENGELVGSNNFWWHENGALKAISIHVNDTLKTTFFNLNGSLSHEEVTLGGELLLTKYYCSNGNIREIYHTGHEPVLVLSYYCSGVLKSIYNMLYSKPVGLYIEYYEDGSLKEKGKYIESKSGNDEARKRIFKQCKKGEFFESIKIP
jgi:hypothetical protein